ncbi:MAG TPA: UbiA family prenyltransferase [bacterium]
MKNAIALLDYVFLLRPTLFYPVWTFYLAGFWSGCRSSGARPSFAFLLASLSALTALLGGVYILNQIEDRKTDRANGKLFLLANGIVPARTAVLEAVLLVSAGLLVCTFLQFRLGLLAAAIFLFTGIFYNYTPFTWKDKPIAGLATNVIGGVLIYAAGWHSAGGRVWLPPESSAYACAVAAAYLCTALPDIRGDRRTGKVTFPVRWGVRYTVIWSMVFEVMSALASLWFRNWILFIPAALALPFFVRAALSRSVPDSVRAAKLSIAGLAAAVSVVYPLTVVPLLGVYGLSKFYYRKRFDFDYPSLDKA